MRLIKGVHEILLSGVRGKTKLPGQIRKSQNWIGGATLNSAFFVPPHPGDLAELLSDLEKFWHSKTDKTPHLIKAAVTHYQFETIHPFLDGNGRTGRLLIILYLINFGLLKKPALYLSSYFEEYRQDYYDALTFVRTQNDLENWIKFFLEGMILTADDSKKIFSAILKLKEEYINIITKNMGKRAVPSLELLEKLFSKPVVTINEIQELISVSFPTANAIAKKFLELGIFSEKTGGERNRIFELKEYLDLFRLRLQL
jgi:Fic family protein